MTNSDKSELRRVVNELQCGAGSVIRSCTRWLQALTANAVMFFCFYAGAVHCIVAECQTRRSVYVEEDEPTSGWVLSVTIHHTSQFNPPLKLHARTTVDQVDVNGCICESIL